MQAEARDKAVFQPEIHPRRRAQRLAGLAQRGGKGGGVKILRRGGGKLRPGGVPQGGQVLPGPVGPAQDGLHRLALGVGQVVLGQQLGVALDDGQRRFQVVGQRGDALRPLLLHRPLRFQRVRQPVPQALHRAQRLLKLPHAGVAQRLAGQVPARQPAAGVGQAGGLGLQAAAGAAGHGKHRSGQRQHQQHGPQRLEIRQHPPQRRVGVGGHKVILQPAQRAVDQRHVQVILAAQGGAVQCQRKLQLGVGHVGGQHVPGCGKAAGGGAGVQQDPAAQVGQSAGVKMVGGHGRQKLGGLLGRAGGAVGRQDEPCLDQHQHQREPYHGHRRAGQPGAQQVAGQQPAQRAGAMFHSFFHRYPIPHAVSMGCRPWARSLARMFLTCSVTAESSAVPSKPNTAS